MVELKLSFGPRTAQMLMAVARHPVLSNAKHASHLPPSWMTLYELTKLDTPLLEAKLKDGTITPKTERKDVVALRPAKIKQARAIKAAPAQKPTPAAKHTQLKPG